MRDNFNFLALFVNTTEGMMLDQKQASTPVEPIELTPALIAKVNLFADCLLEGMTNSAIKRRLRQFKPMYGPGVDFEHLENLALQEVAARAKGGISNELIHHLWLYQQLRRLGTLIQERLRGTERVHQMLGIQSPAEMLRIGKSELWAVDMMPWKNMVTHAEHVIQNLKILINAGPMAAADILKSGADPEETTTANQGPATNGPETNEAG